jgi:hypothetical protein
MNGRAQFPLPASGNVIIRRAETLSLKPSRSLPMRTVHGSQAPRWGPEAVGGSCAVRMPAAASNTMSVKKRLGMNGFSYGWTVKTEFMK